MTLSGFWVYKSGIWREGRAGKETGRKFQPDFINALILIEYFCAACGLLSRINKHFGCPSFIRGQEL